MLVSAKNPPLVLSLALERLDRILVFPDLIHSGSRFRTMRKERIQAVYALLSSMIKSMSLQHHGVFIRLFKKTKAVPLTVKELAKASGLSERRAKRCLLDLKNAHLLETKKQWKRSLDGGKTLLVAPCIRCLTRKFWAFLGLWRLFVESVKFMQSRPQIALKATPINVSRNTLPLGNSILKVREEDQKLSRLRNEVFLCLVRGHHCQKCSSPTCSSQRQHICSELFSKLR